MSNTHGNPNRTQSPTSSVATARIRIMSSVDANAATVLTVGSSSLPRHTEHPDANRALINDSISINTSRNMSYRNTTTNSRYEVVDVDDGDISAPPTSFTVNTMTNITKGKDLDKDESHVGTATNETTDSVAAQKKPTVRLEIPNGDEIDCKNTLQSFDDVISVEHPHTPKEKRIELQSNNEVHTERKLQSLETSDNSHNKGYAKKSATAKDLTKPIILPDGQEMNAKTTLQSFDTQVGKPLSIQKNPNSIASEIINPVVDGDVEDERLRLHNRDETSGRSNVDRVDLMSLPNSTNNLINIQAVAVRSYGIVVDAHPYHSVVGVELEPYDVQEITSPPPPPPQLQLQQQVFATTSQSRPIPLWKKMAFQRSFILGILVLSIIVGTALYFGIRRTPGNDALPTPSPSALISDKILTISPTIVPTTVSKTEGLTSFINGVTLLGRNISVDGVAAEDVALRWLIENDPLFRTTESWLPIVSNSSVISVEQFRFIQRYALLTMRFQQVDVNGAFLAGWKNIDGWPMETDECNWFGTTCSQMVLAGIDDPQYVVTDISYNYVSMTGTLSADLALLSMIRHADFSNNTLFGTIPATIGEWTALTYFSIGYNALTGRLPLTIGKWKDLIVFIGSNIQNLVGSLPSVIGQWTALTHFEVAYSQFTGGLPSTIGEWTALKHLTFSNNYALNGTLPSTIGTWTALEYVNFEDCNLNGEIPSKIGQWVALKHFYASGNSGLDGTIPSTIGQWTDLTYFDVSYDVGLTGTLPSTIGFWTDIRHVTIYNSYSLTGTIPTTIGNWTALTFFEVSEIDALTGPFPFTIGQWTTLKHFSVVANALTGTLPSSIGQWTALTYFDVSSNLAVNGTLPSTIGQWTALNYFHASDIALSGTIPSTIGQWTSLTYFNVAYNTLIGSLPTTTGQWTSLEYFEFSNNYAFNGTLPSVIGYWTMLTFFRVAELALTGTLPSTIGQWVMMLSFEATSIVTLTGTLPSTIGQWTLLTYFGVAYNALTGTIPSSVANWSVIETASFYENRFTGTMPIGICRNESFYLAADCESEINCSCCGCCSNCF